MRLRRRVVSIALIGAALALLMHNQLVPFSTHFFGLTENNFDLDTYRAAVHASWDGRSLYQEPALRGAWFVYPPFATFFLAPLAWLGFDVAKYVLLALSICVLALIAWRILRLAGIRADLRLGVLSAALAVIVIDVEPVQATLWWGQINVLLMAMVMLDLLRPAGSRWRGIGLGLAAGIKLTPLIFLPYLLLTRQWRASATAAITFVVTAALTWPVLPKDSAWFWTHLGDTAHISAIDHLANQSINGFLARYFEPEPRPEWLWVALSLLALAACFAVAVWAHRRDEHALAVVIVGLTGCAVSPFSWAAHWVWFAPAIIWLVAKAVTTQGVWARGWIFRAAGLYAMVFMWTLHRPGRNHTTMYFSGVYWNYLDLRRFWTGQLASGWYPLVFGCFVIAAVSWLRLSTTRDPSDAMSVTTDDLGDYPPEFRDDELTRA
ncbi:polyprenol-phosphate-mannose-dependent alpha-(1,2)-phosphatidylinositol mannoside mannosyltransferase [Mycolicibacterium conceptionense]|jgi:alpha-1,2-mannosyltransferase|uniref:Polyprenol-phosphate-mannose-dependent alpha-(1,2)-phosphatidylinositol mannoside mannosyltransferase n=2 Tax=Mycolicibacterium TaxID=1866885 RepID=A0ABR5FYI2_9MYCO|nr:MULTISPECIES: glycosyltransferase 87 family protein [Mycolicibacterium]KLI08935.1 polyprenol-phosphate-mannose-dependent alpha-(1,2)-phosphatidylinositol mannoside mannosyltransferase [Mycolicibacterium senegalense]KLO52992.1 polyprenol-phosphate-mannose-dependent alpha-(1,2)-phosphatidylinositol mannoside mannosyltransferase [Mycolicibacterium senegalense]KMV14961.1 polyprenol-phosphate-mannose-dependent alpha-(1,2)-phosphatidylinositol mannoside mannosyltransferase [Mycolicibacterium concep